MPGGRTSPARPTRASPCSSPRILGGLGDRPEHRDPLVGRAVEGWRGLHHHGIERGTDPTVGLEQDRLGDPEDEALPWLGRREKMSQRPSNARACSEVIPSMLPISRVDIAERWGCAQSTRSSRNGLACSATDLGRLKGFGLVACHLPRVRANRASFDPPPRRANDPNPWCKHGESREVLVDLARRPVRQYGDLHGECLRCRSAVGEPHWASSPLFPDSSDGRLEGNGTTDRRQSGVRRRPTFKPHTQWARLSDALDAEWHRGGVTPRPDRRWRG